MSQRLITLTTDFGEGSPYVAAMKGVILGINPDARLVDLSHRIPPQNILHAAWFLASALPWFPPETMHVIVVDPGVGTKRKLLLVHAGTQWLLVPDNGCWTLAAERMADRPDVRWLKERSYWLPEVSRTFHGRDILAPVAAHLSLGLAPEKCGPPATYWTSFLLPPPALAPRRITGEVIFIDDFGNLITNIPARALRQPGFRSPRVRVGDHNVKQFVGTYGEAEEGSPVGLIGSEGHLEVAVINGSAAKTLSVGVGCRVEVIAAPRKRT